MKIVVTGGRGFIGRNLCLRLYELGHSSIALITRGTAPADAARLLQHADFVFHLAGVNRSSDEREFTSGNVEYTAALCDTLLASGRPVPVLFSSSTQAEQDNAYGRSKRAAEDVLARYAQQSGAPVYPYRLCNVFGKWCRPDYNSVIATFCHNIAHGLPIDIRDPEKVLQLVYIDDVVDVFSRLPGSQLTPDLPAIAPTYQASVGEVAALLTSFAQGRHTLFVPPAGSGFVRALYATFLSYLPARDFSSKLTLHSDARGEFVEVLKTRDSGQVSYFTAGCGVTRGEHYHHTKCERFLVLRGKARFAFRHIVTGETFDIVTDGQAPAIVDSVPGWIHSVTNVGIDQLIVLVWASEVFDVQKPDTVRAALPGMSGIWA